MFRKIYILFVAISVLFGNFIKPPNNSDFSYTHILFKWDQLANASSYNLYIENLMNNEDNVNIIDSSLVSIIDNFSWGNSYKVKLRPILESGVYGNWVDSLILNIEDLPENYNNFIPIIEGEDNINNNNYTIIHEQIIDKAGNPIWFWKDLGDPELFVVTRLLENGTFLGLLRGQGYDINAHNFDLNGEQFWSSPQRVQREILPFEKDSDIHFIGLVKETYLNAVPTIEPFASQFADAGLDSVNWYSDAIVEWDENGQEVWRWSCKDHFSFEDIDPNYSLNGIDHIIDGSKDLDWTHCNSIFFDYEESVLYLSTRHLSRITKIDYPSGEVVWNLGKDFTSGQIIFGNDLGLSGQHSFEKLDNGNFIMYDNGNFDNPELTRALEISIDDDNLTYNIEWEHYLPSDLFTHKWGDADRLINGNTLITAGASGALIEVDSLNNLVWQVSNIQPTYRSERIYGLYPLSFSFILPNFYENGDSPIFYFPLGQSEFSLEIFNEGYLDYDFSYMINDELGWFNEDGIISVNSGDSYLLNISPNVIESELGNNILVEVCPISKYDVECKSLEIVGISCLTNSDNNFNECPDLLLGDINSDGLVNILDVVQLVNIVLLNQFESLADINSDDLVNILDIVQLVNIILL